jgi:hypothetical protein
MSPSEVAQMSLEQYRDFLDYATKDLKAQKRALERAKRKR